MRPLPLLVLLVTLAFAGSAFRTPFEGFDSGQLPIPQEDPPIQPAGWAFSIWSLIFAWLIASAAFGVWRRAEDAGWDRARLPLLISLALGTPWLAIASRSAIWASALIVVMAALAIRALIVAPDRDRWWLAAPLGLYAGWLTAATFVALGVTLAGFGVLTDALGWAYVGIPLALLLAGAVLLRRPDPAYGLAVGWALFGIAVANGAAHPGVTLLAVAGMPALAGVAWARRRHEAA